MILTADKLRALTDCIRAGHREECENETCSCITNEEHVRRLGEVAASVGERPPSPEEGGCYDGLTI